MLTLVDPVERLCPQVSLLPLNAICLPLTNTVPLLVDCVRAEQWAWPPFWPQGGCGLTGALTKAIGLPLTNTDGSPLCITPPAEFASPTRCMPGTIYPIKILFLTGLMPVVASR